MIYFIFSVIWIVSGDFLLFNHIPTDLLISISLTKGIAFVILSSLLMYYLLFQFSRQLQDREDFLEQSRRYIEKQEVTLEFLLDQLPIILWELDSAGNIIKLMGNNVSALNRPRDEIINKKIFDLFAGVPRVVYHTELALKGEGSHWQFNTNEKHYENYYEPIINEGEVVGAIGLAVDVTDREELVTNLEITKHSLETMNRLDLLGSILGKVTHDLNNYFTLIIGYLEVINKDPKPENINRFLPPLNRSVNSASELLQNLLSYSRVSDQEEKITLSLLINELKPILTNLFDDTLRFSLNLDTSIGNIEFSKLKMETILMNLITNAVDAIEGNSGLVELNISQATGKNQTPMVKISVSDDGKGIHQKDLPRIFDPLYTTKPKGKGTGLGLSIVSDHVNNLGGSIEVTSDPEQNKTVFDIYLPIKDDNVPSASTDETTKLTPKSAFNIMIIDDDPTIVEYIHEILQEHSSNIFSYSNPTEALEDLKENGKVVDIYLVDFMMPDIDGIELVKRLQRIDNNAQCILMSGYRSFDNISTEMEKIYFLKKPFGPADLLDHIARILN